MGRTFDSIDEDIRTFLVDQHLFFVASAPSVGGHVNVSPKGLGTYRRNRNAPSIDGIPAFVPEPG